MRQSPMGRFTLDTESRANPRRRHFRRLHSSTRSARETRELLRELAYVLQLTRQVRDAMAEPNQGYNETDGTATAEEYIGA